jgi:hypothetical protein
MAGYLGTKAVLLSTTSATVGGDSTVGGDLTVDTNTLYVDSTNNRVGIGNAAPTQALDVTGDIVTSGGVYLGGTGSANLLDDYEEGTWTPSFRNGFSGTPTFANQAGRYTKIGRMVYCDFYIRVTGTGDSSQIQVDGLPFTSTSNNLSRGGGLSTYVDMITGNTFQFYGGRSISYFSCYIDGNTGPSFSGSITSKYLIGIYTYETDA